MKVALNVVGDFISYDIIKVCYLSRIPMQPTKSITLYNIIECVLLPIKGTYISHPKFHIQRCRRSGFIYLKYRYKSPGTRQLVEDRISSFAIKIPPARHYITLKKNKTSIILTYSRVRSSILRYCIKNCWNSGRI